MSTTSSSLAASLPNTTLVSEHNCRQYLTPFVVSNSNQFQPRTLTRTALRQLQNSSKFTSKSIEQPLNRPWSAPRAAIWCLLMASLHCPLQSTLVAARSHHNHTPRLLETLFRPSLSCSPSRLLPFKKLYLRLPHPSWSLCLALLLTRKTNGALSIDQAVALALPSPPSTPLSTSDPLIDMHASHSPRHG